MSVFMCKGTGVTGLVSSFNLKYTGPRVDLQRFCHMGYALVKSFGNFTVYNAIVFMGTPICTFLKRSKLVSPLKRLKVRQNAFSNSYNDFLN